MKEQDCKFHNRYVVLIIVLLMTPLSGMGVDITVPSLPHLEAIFPRSDLGAELSVSFYILGYGIFQLFAGVISDVYGRRPVILISTLLFIVVCLAIPYAKNMLTMIVLRCLQGAFVAASTAIARAIVTDSFSDSARRGIANYLVVAWGLGPIVAPFIGGVLQDFIGWDGAFYFLAIYGLLIVFLVFYALPETNIYPVQSLSVSIKNIHLILINSKFTFAAISAGVCLSNLYVFNIFSSFILINGKGYTPVEYGEILIVVGSSWLLGSLFNRFFLTKLNSNFVVWMVLIAALFSGLSIPLLNTMNAGLTYGFIIPSFFVIFFSNIAFTRCFGICLGLFPSMAGVAGALTGTVFIVVGGAWTLAAGAFHAESVNDIAGIFTAITISGLFVHACSKNQSARGITE